MLAKFRKMAASTIAVALCLLPPASFCQQASASEKVPARAEYPYMITKIKRTFDFTCEKKEISLSFLQDGNTTSLSEILINGKSSPAWLLDKINGSFPKFGQFGLNSIGCTSEGVDFTAEAAKAGYKNYPLTADDIVLIRFYARFKDILS